VDDQTLAIESLPRPLAKQDGDISKDEGPASNRSPSTRLTMGVYTHVELSNRTAAVEALRAPPESKKADGTVDAKRPEAV
jgi:hypothetical protein